METALANSQNLAIHGYHNKDKNSYSLMDSTLPLLVDEKYSPFLITKGYHYSISSQSVEDLLRSYQLSLKYQKRKYLFANLLIVPGLLFALMYIARQFNLLEHILFLDTLSKSWIADFTFWLSMLGVLILWHDYFRKRTHPVKLPTTERFSQKEMVAIKIAGVQFEKYKRLAASDFIKDETKELLYSAVNHRNINTFSLLNMLINDLTVRKVLIRSNVSLTKSQFTQLNINPRTFPQYPTKSLRSLIIYALEEAIITNSLSIDPIHIFLSMTRVYPSLRKQLKKQDSSLEILRESTKYELHKKGRYRFLEPFNIKKTFYPTGGIGHKWIYTFSEKSKNYLQDITVEISKERQRYGVAHNYIFPELISTIERQDGNNNALIIGSEGTGKSSIIKALAQKINWGEVPFSLRGKRVIKIGSDFIINKSPQIEPKYFSNILKSLESKGDNIYYIDNILSVFYPIEGRKTLNKTQEMLADFISNTNSPIISTTKYSDYQQYLKPESSIIENFTAMEIKKVSGAKTLTVLQEKISQFEKENGIYISMPAIITVVELASREDLPYQQPKFAVDLLKDIAQKASTDKIKVLTQTVAYDLCKNWLKERYHIDIKGKTDTQQVIQTKFGDKQLPNQFSIQNTVTRLQIAERIKTKVIGRDNEIENILASVNRSDSRDNPNQIFTTVLLGGLQGSGKSYLAKVFSEELYPSLPMIKIDLEKYQYVADIQKYLHRFANQIGETGEYTIRGIIFIDKIEYLNPETYKYIIEILKKGRVGGQYRRTYKFIDNIIFATTYVGTENFKNSLETKTLNEEEKRQALMNLRSKFRNSLLDTFDYSTMLLPYSVYDLTKIVEVELETFARVFIENGFNLTWENSVPQILANRILERKTSLTNLREIVHALTNESILEKAHNSNTNSVQNKDVKLRPVTVDKWLRENA